MNTYIVTVKHDTGRLPVKFKIKTVAQDEPTAKFLVMQAESCPARAIVGVREAALTGKEKYHAYKYLRAP